MIDPVLSPNPIARRTASVAPRRPAWQRRLNLAFVITACCAAAWPVLGRFTHHPDETVTILMVPALAGLLWWGWPGVRRISLWEYTLYLLALLMIVAAAEAVVAYVANGQVLWIEVFWGLYFVVAWRLAWAVWAGTVGRCGERWRRWGRRKRQTRHGEGETRSNNDPRTQGWVRAGMTRLIAPARTMLTLLVFVPLVFGAMVHRFKIGDPAELARSAGLPVEQVYFRTADGLVLSGWFLAEPGNDSTVVICHGAGANKSNFIDYMRVFRFRGYNSLIFDFRGHGASQGHTCTFGLFEDADVKAAVDWLKTERTAQSRHVYGLGSSMGAMSLARAAANDSRIEAVVLDSCFASAPLMARQHLGRIPLVGPPLAKLLPAALSLHAGRSFQEIDARPAVASLSPRPVLFIQGTEDIVVKPANLDILFDYAKEPKQKWLGPGPHSNIMTTDFTGVPRAGDRVPGQVPQELTRATRCPDLSRHSGVLSHSQRFHGRK